MPCEEKGMLYLVPTPIGNMEDMTFRAVRILREADLIAAEDTRNSKRLLTHYDVHTPMTSYHEFNKNTKARVLTDRMLEGKTVALITDAGTPGISDPGWELVRMAMDEGLRVSSLPGACALITALTMSGQDARRFCFEGFLPQKNRDKRAVLERLSGETRTAVLYEAPHRLEATLQTLFEVLGDRELTVCRELTKVHEEAVVTTLSGALERLAVQPARGEYVLVLKGADEKQLLRQQQLQWESLSLEEHVKRYQDDGCDRKEAMKRAASDRGISKRDVYRMLIGKEEQNR